ncbi:MAG: cobalt ECF transporter T component CbiQ [Bacillota bacterium]
MLYVDEFVYTNKLRYAHPLEKFTFAILTMLIGLTTKEALVNILIVIFMLGLLIWRAQIPAFVIGKLLLIPCFFLFMGILTILISFSETGTGMLFSLKLSKYHLGITAGSIQTAFSTALRSSSSVVCLYFLTLTTPTVELIYILQTLRIPNVLIELMVLIYRFIFVFIETAFNIYTAQSSRWGYSSFRKSIYSFGMLFANLWGKVFLKSQALFTSLLSRGYDKELKVLYPNYSFTKNYLLFAFLEIILVYLSFF